MSLPKTDFQGKLPGLVEVVFEHGENDSFRPQQRLTLDQIDDHIDLDDKSTTQWPAHPRPILPPPSRPSWHSLPRQCSITTFTTDLCDALHAEFASTELLALPVDDTAEGYSYRRAFDSSFHRMTWLPTARLL